MSFSIVWIWVSVGSSEVHRRHCRLHTQLEDNICRCHESLPAARFDMLTFFIPCDVNYWCSFYLSHNNKIKTLYMFIWKIWKNKSWSWELQLWALCVVFLFGGIANTYKTIKSALIQFFTNSKNMCYCIVSDCSCNYQAVIVRLINSIVFNRIKLSSRKKKCQLMYLDNSVIYTDTLFVDLNSEKFVILAFLEHIRRCDQLKSCPTFMVDNWWQNCLK